LWFQDVSSKCLWFISSVITVSILTHLLNYVWCSNYKIEWKFAHTNHGSITGSLCTKEMQYHQACPEAHRGQSHSGLTAVWPATRWKGRLYALRSHKNQNSGRKMWDCNRPHGLVLDRNKKKKINSMELCGTGVVLSEKVSYSRLHNSRSGSLARMCLVQAVCNVSKKEKSYLLFPFWK